MITIIVTIAITVLLTFLINCIYCNKENKNLTFKIYFLITKLLMYVASIFIIVKEVSILLSDIIVIHDLNQFTWTLILNIIALFSFVYTFALCLKEVNKKGAFIIALFFIFFESIYIWTNMLIIEVL